MDRQLEVTAQSHRQFLALCHHAVNTGQLAELTLISDRSERLSGAAASGSPLRKSTLRAGQVQWSLSGVPSLCRCVSR
ncbi:hypothetical protein PBY51_007260 [Eleginops maclovinus]|nr:hypothetical protein PBY51_007260 [Eleginops maclovinus]